MSGVYMQKEYDEVYGQYKAMVDQALTGFFQPTEDGADGLRQAMRYSLLAEGKRVRPVLCLEFCRLCGGDARRCLPVACGVEMLHTYSLIHDDLPCMDDDDMRRGAPSCHKQFGETAAVLAGDCLQAEAFAAVCAADIDEAARFRCCRILSRAAGLDGICGGQYMDLAPAAESEQELIAVDTGKTASLMGAACAMGAAAAGGDEKTIAAADAFGRALGMAFQCRDDLLDGDGFAALLGEERCRAMTEAYTNAALELLAAWEDAGFLRELTVRLAGRQA